MLLFWTFQTIPTTLLETILSLPKPFPPHSCEPNHEAPKPLFMLHFERSQALPTPLLGTMKHFLMLQTEPFPPHSGEPWSTPKPLFMLHFKPAQTLPTPLLGLMRNTHPRFHTSFSKTILGNHAKHPTPLCFIFNLPKPFPPHSWEPWSTQTPFHASFLPFPSPSHHTLGNHEARNPFSCFIFSLPKPFPQHSWEPFWASQALPTPLLWAMKHLTPVFMLHFWLSQTLPNPRLGTMKHPNPFSCFILSFPKPFPPNSWEPWSTQTPFDASCFMVPKSGVGAKAKNEALKGVWVLHGSQERGGKGLGRLEMKHEKGFGCFSWFVRVGWEGAPTTLLGTILSLPSLFNLTLVNHEAPNPLFILHLAFPDPSQTLPSPFNALSSMPGEMQFSKNKLKENMLCQCF